MVNNEIEMIPACFLSAHALSLSWEDGVRAAATGVGWCCRWRRWLLKYKIYVVVEPQRFAEHFYFSLRSSADSAVSIELIPAPLVLQSFAAPPLPHCIQEAARPPQPDIAANGARVLYAC